MARRHKAKEKVVAKLRHADVLMSQGRPVAEAVHSIGVTEVTYYSWAQRVWRTEVGPGEAYEGSRA